MSTIKLSEQVENVKRSLKCSVSPNNLGALSSAYLFCQKITNVLSKSVVVSNYKARVDILYCFIR